jgi:hypothetical protein
MSHSQQVQRPDDCHGSVDDSEDYVFEVSPSIEQKGNSRILCDWQVLNDTSTMISLWNYSATTQSLVITFYWDGGSYNYPVKLNARQSTTLDVAEIVHAQLPDDNGNILPPYAHEGAS